MAMAVKQKKEEKGGKCRKIVHAKTMQTNKVMKRSSRTVMKWEF